MKKSLFILCCILFLSSAFSNENTLSFGFEYGFNKMWTTSESISYGSFSINTDALKFDHSINAIGGTILFRHFGDRWYNNWSLGVFFESVLTADTTLSSTYSSISPVHGSTKGSDYDISMIFGLNLGIPIKFATTKVSTFIFEFGPGLGIALLKQPEGGGFADIDIGLFVDIEYQYYFSEHFYVDVNAWLGAYASIIGIATIGPYSIETNGFALVIKPSIGVGYKF